MEFVNKAYLNVKKQDKIYSFVCDHNSPLGEVYDAWQEIGQFLIHKINEAHALKCKEQKKEE